MEYDSILEVNARSIITTYHDYRHIIPAIDSPRVVFTGTFLGVTEDFWGDTSITNDHLHFTVEWDQTLWDYGFEYNPIWPDQDPAYKFDTLCTDVNKPVIRWIKIVKDSTHEEFPYNPGENAYYVPCDAKWDILVNAWDSTTYPGGVDLYNGVFSVSYAIDDTADFANNTNIIFDGKTMYWLIDYVYDLRRTGISWYTYIPTNWMDCNWYLDTLLVARGWHHVYVKVTDPFGNSTVDMVRVRIHPKCDLRIAKIVPSDTMVMVGDSITVSITVINDGPWVSDSCWLATHIRPPGGYWEPLKWWWIPPLDSGETLTRVTPLFTASRAGILIFKGEVDIWDYVDESNEDNNIKYDSIKFCPKPIISLIWPNEPQVVVEENRTYYVHYSGEAPDLHIEKIRVLFSPDSGITWTDTIGKRDYSSYPDTIENDSILWCIVQSPTWYGRIRTVLYTNIGHYTAEDTNHYDITVRPATPANFSASINSTLNNVTLTWQDRSNYEEGYIVEKKAIAGWQLKDTVHDTMYNEYVRKYRDHWYRIYGYDEPTGIHSDSIYSWTTSSPILSDEFLTSVA